MSSDVVLSSALRTNLLSLQSTQSNIDKVQNILATGLKINSPLDNPQSFFTARSLNNRAGDLASLLDGIGQSITSIQQANNSVQSLTKLVEQADSIVSQALDEVNNAQTEAKVAGATSLAGITDLTDINGIAAGDQIEIRISDPDNADNTFYNTVTISADDSIEELVTKINAASGTVGTSTSSSSYDSNGAQIVKASLNADGNLEIKALNGGNLNIRFDADTTDNAANSALAQALGFGEIAQPVFNGTSASEYVEVTAVAGGSLVSGVFYQSDGDIADASDLLTNVYDADSGGTTRFGSGTSTDAITISVNGSTAQSFTIAGQSIQGLVDSINNNSDLKELIRATYDTTTGQLSVQSIDTSVATVEVGVSRASLTSAATTTSSVAGAAVEADFDFGLSSGALAATSSVSGTGSGTSSIATTQLSESYILGSSTATLAQLERDYNKLLTQIDGLVEDAGYRGTNLLNGDDLVTFFNEDRSNSIRTLGSDLTSGGLGLTAANFQSEASIESQRDQVADGISALRNFSSSLANDLAIIQTREDFTKETINTLKGGADKLTVADQNEEGAKLLALQTRQQLGVTALSLAAQSQQSVLRLF